MMSQRQLLGRSWMMIGSTNIRPIVEVIAPAVCLMIAPRPYAISAAPGEIRSVPLNVTMGGPLPGPPAGGLTLAFAGIVMEWNSEAPTPEPDIAAWPTKNEMNDVTSETTRVTEPNTISFAA